MNNSTADVGVNLNVDDVILGIVYSVMSVLVIVSNGIVVIVVVTSSELHLPTLWNISFMAFCDFIHGVYVLLFVVPSKFLNQFVYDPSLMFTAACTSTILTTQGILNTVIAVLDRCFAICSPLNYVRAVTLQRFIIVILLSFLVNIGRLCLLIFPEKDFYFNEHIALCVFDFHTTRRVLATTGVSAVAFIIIVVCVAKITRAVYLSSHFSTTDSHETTNVMKVSLCVSLTAAIFCLAYLPAGVTVVWNLVASKDDVPSYLIQFAMTAIMSNSLLDVVVYAAAYHPFRDALLRLCCRTYYRRRRQKAVVVM